MNSCLLVGRPRTSTVPPGFDQLVSEPVRVMDQRREALRTDVGLLPREAEDKDGEVVFGTATAQTDSGR